MTELAPLERMNCLIKRAHARISISGSYPIGCLPLEMSQSEDSQGLEVNAILIGEGQSAILFLSIDSMYIGPVIRSYCERVFGDLLEPHQIFLSASHTHNAPGLDDTKPKLSTHSDEFLSATKEAILDVQDRLDKSPWKKATLAATTFFPKGIVHRRKQPPTWMVKTGLLGPEYLQISDTSSTPMVSATSLAFWSGEELLGAICIYPCHPVAYPFKSEVSPDFVGSFREAIRSKNRLQKSSEVPSFVFMQGASGDLRPLSWPAPKVIGLSDLVFRLFVGAAFGRFDKGTWECWSRERSEEVLASIYADNAVADSGKNSQVTASRLEVPLSELFVHVGDQARNISVHSVALGGLKIIGVSSEISWGIQSELIEVLPSNCQYTFVGCIDDTFGYTPSESQIAEGGYEVDGWMSSFGISPARPVAERVQTLKELVILVASQTK